MRRFLRTCFAFWVIVSCAGSALGASLPFVRFVATIGVAAVQPGTCVSTGPTPAFWVDVDLGAAGTYRYSPAYYRPYFFDDEGEFNTFFNSDVAFFVSNPVTAAQAGSGVLPIAPLSSWYGTTAGLPEHAELALRVAAYDERGIAVALSRVSWDCTTGVVLTVEHKGNAAEAGPGATVRAVEFYNSARDHFFMSANAGEIDALDNGDTAGWQRTGLGFNVYAAPTGVAVPVCRFYLPPAVGDSHFYSADVAECTAVHARFPAFVYESAAVFHSLLPDMKTGSCPEGTIPVYRLWNARSDSNHRYTTDPAVRAQMVAAGYVAEGYGADAVIMCAVR